MGMEVKRGRAFLLVELRDGDEEAALAALRTLARRRYPDAVITDAVEALMRSGPIAVRAAAATTTGAWHRGSEAEEEQR